MSASYSFGEYRLDCAGRRLWRADEPVALPAKAFECIVYLVEHRSRAVGRDELISAVWGRIDTTDNVLGQTILHARKALSDTGREQVAIRTVPRFGYQWVLPLVSSPPAIAAIAPMPMSQADEAVATDGAVVATPAVEDGRRPRRVVARLFVLALVASLIVVVATRMHRPAATASSSIERPTLVLPVSTVSNSGEPIGWIRLGIMDLIAEKLRAAGMPVVPSDNIVALVHEGSAEPDAGSLARTTHAGLVVAATVERVGMRWRVRIETPFGRDPRLTVSADGDDVLDAATQAARRLTLALGLASTDIETPNGDRTQQTLVRQLDAALLAGKVDEAARSIQSAAPALQSLPQVRLRAARLAYQRGELDRAQSLFADIAAGPSSESDTTLRARALNGLGAVALVRNEFPRAFESFDQAIRALPDDNSQWLGNALNGRAAALAAQRLYEPALADFARARVALEQTGDGLALATLDSNLASLALSRDDLHEAALAFARVGERFRTYAAPGFELDARINALQVNVLLLDLPAARDDDARIATLLKSESDPGRRVRAALARYDLLLQTGATAQADALLAQTRTAAASIANEELAGDLDIIEGERALALGNVDAASRLAERVARLPDNPNDPRGRARAGLLRVRAHLASNDLPGADEAQRILAAWAALGNLPVGRVYAALGAAHVSDKHGESAQAARHLDDALSAAESTHVPFDVVRVVVASVDHAIEVSDTSRLAALVQRAAPWAADNYDAALAQARAYRALGWTAAWQGALARADKLSGSPQPR